MEEQYLSFLVENQSGIRLDKYLKEKIQQYSRTFIQGLIKNGQVKVNKKVVLKPGFLLEEGQIVEIFIKPQFFDIKPEKINLDLDTLNNIKEMNNCVTVEYINGIINIL